MVGEAVDVALGAGVGVVSSSVAVGVAEFPVQLASVSAKITTKMIDCFFIVFLP